MSRYNGYRSESLNGEPCIAYMKQNGNAGASRYDGCRSGSPNGKPCIVRYLVQTTSLCSSSRERRRRLPIVLLGESQAHQIAFEQIFVDVKHNETTTYRLLTCIGVQVTHQIAFEARATHQNYDANT